MKRIILSLVALMVTVSVVPLPALAETSDTIAVTGGLRVGSSSAKIGVKASTTIDITRAKSRADEEISRRIKNLSDLSVRISEMKRLTAEQKASLSASISAQISALTTLKSQIDAETVLEILKTEIQSISREYRIYMLVMPQIHIAAAADRILTVTSVGGNLDTLATKIEARLNATTTASTNDLKALDTELRAKMTEAKSLAQAAVTETILLKPDNGDASVQASNKVALDDAREKIKNATTALKTAVADLHKLMAALKLKGSSELHASSTGSH
ncbi:MAG: hypothetical protein JWN18_248 [Parcubacteria group bacterium]|nr:hypothetical protein [Parcubacteria group bacterium]